MQELDDHQLLASYVAEYSGAAFAELVARYVNLVYSTGLRCTGDAHAAEEIAQAVFIILARKAPSLGHKTVLSGWLYHTTRLTAANHLRTERRRHQREQEAYMQSLANENPGDDRAWQQIAPLLDDALAGLGTADRDAVVLRYFENKSAREIGAALRMEPATAHKRVERAVGKLRKFFLKRGVTLSVAAIAGAVSANSVQAAPVALGKTISAVAIVKGATAGTSTITLVKGALKLMAWSNAKTVVAAGLGILLVTGGTVAVVKAVVPPKVDDALWALKVENLDKAPPVLILRPAKFRDRGEATIGDVIPKVLDAGPPVRMEQVNVVDRAIVHNDNLQGMMRIAYSEGLQRIVMPAELPDERYDLMMTLREHPREALQAAIRKQLGFTAHTETVTTNVLLLRVSDAALLAEHAGVDGGPVHFELTSNSWVFANYSVGDAANYLETSMGIPVEVTPGLTGNYNGTITVPGSAPRRVIKRQSLQTVTAELNRMGLDLVATNMPIEMLVVEKMR